MVQQTFLSIQVKENIINLYVRLPHELRNDLRLRILGNQEISGKSQIFIDLVHSPSPEMKILSVLIKIS